MGQKPKRFALFLAKPLDTNMVPCSTEKLCGRTNTAPHGAHPLYRLSTASKRKIYQSEKQKVIGQTTVAGVPSSLRSRPEEGEHWPQPRHYRGASAVSAPGDL